MIDARSVSHNAGLGRQRETMQALLDELVAAAPDIGLCHHDPVPSNVISANGQLYLLDWEYATRAYLAMDYAVLSVDWGIADKTIIENTNIDPNVLDLAKLSTAISAISGKKYRPGSDPGTSLIFSEGECHPAYGPWKSSSSNTLLPGSFYAKSHSR